jgi:hypothetical protein
MRSIFKNMCELLREDFGDANNSYYVAISKFTPWENEPESDVYLATNEQGETKLREEMMFGKKLDAGDAAFLVTKTVWAANTVYAFYDDADPDLETKNFFVVNSAQNVFKCIDNNKGARSTEEPMSVTTSTFQLADGYIWKYLYTVSSANNTKFGSTTQIPVDVNPTVTAAAIRGTVDHIVVEDGGDGFNRYAVGTIVAASNNNIVKLSANATTNSSFFDGMSFYISAGTGDGTLTSVVSSVANNSGNYAVLANTVTVDTSTNYIISPKITIEGNGSGAKAYCEVNLVFNRIEKVHILDAGSGYTSATASVRGAGGSGAELRAIISPLNGHGSSVIEELNAFKFIIITTITGSEGNVIPTNVSYRNYALVKNPKAANGAIYTSQIFNSMVRFNVNITSANTGFVLGETFTGQTSGAIGYLATSNTTHVEGTIYGGTFANNEVIITSDSKITGTISNINNPEINVYTGEVLFYQPVDTVERTVYSLEDVGFILTNASGN